MTVKKNEGQKRHYTDINPIKYCIFAAITKQNSYLASKPRYEILDGLRGVAAMMVVAFHLLETYYHMESDQPVNHGYLAVDFFFALSSHPYLPTSTHIAVGVSLFVLAIFVAYASLKLYDMPVREWLKRKLF